MCLFWQSMFYVKYFNTINTLRVMLRLRKKPYRKCSTVVRNYTRGKRAEKYFAEAFVRRRLKNTRRCSWRNATVVILYNVHKSIIWGASINDVTSTFLTESIHNLGEFSSYFVIRYRFLRIKSKPNTSQPQISYENTHVSRVIQL